MDDRKKDAKRIILVIAAIALVGAYYFFDLGNYLDLGYIKSSQDRYRTLYAEHGLAVVAGYMISYVIVTALSLPGAAVMSLAGGALFGLAAGTVIVSLASTIGATLACFVSRYLLRDWVLSKFGDRLSGIQKGIEEEGPFYLFTLRLVPIFPFFMINLVMGLTPIRLRTFYWVSQVGMFPATVVYVNAGRELSRIESLSGILSPGLIGSFILLGLLPIAARKALAWYRKRRK
ncbi:MAG TPA: TVP38/TMEM64 family protein [Dissulfurispiraceae bacterium]|nr:TVP38/TMEM64 family protein [Dissulfurispiraceae bacterium]